jgi:hypothetical protein
MQIEKKTFRGNLGILTPLKTTNHPFSTACFSFLLISSTAISAPCTLNVSDSGLSAGQQVIVIDLHGVPIVNMSS